MANIVKSKENTIRCCYYFIFTLHRSCSIIILSQRPWLYVTHFLREDRRAALWQ